MCYYLLRYLPNSLHLCYIKIKILAEKIRSLNKNIVLEKTHITFYKQYLYTNCDFNILSLIMPINVCNCWAKTNINYLYPLTYKLKYGIIYSYDKNSFLIMFRLLKILQHLNCLKKTLFPSSTPFCFVYGPSRRTSTYLHSL